MLKVLRGASEQCVMIVLMGFMLSAGIFSGWVTWNLLFHKNLFLGRAPESFRDPLSYAVPLICNRRPTSWRLWESHTVDLRESPLIHLGPPDGRIVFKITPHPFFHYWFIPLELTARSANWNGQRLQRRKKYWLKSSSVLQINRSYFYFIITNAYSPKSKSQG